VTGTGGTGTGGTGTGGTGTGGTGTGGTGTGGTGSTGTGGSGTGTGTGTGGSGTGGHHGCSLLCRHRLHVLHVDHQRYLRDHHLTGHRSVHRHGTGSGSGTGTSTGTGSGAGTGSAGSGNGNGTTSSTHHPRRYDGRRGHCWRNGHLLGHTSNVWHRWGWDRLASYQADHQRHQCRYHHAAPGEVSGSSHRQGQSAGSSAGGLLRLNISL
jgi:hypothetical protein